jgi:hypothetical protein
MYWLAATKTLYTNPVAHPLGLRAYWKEWQADRGGPGGEFPARPEDALRVRNETTGREQWKLPNGNLVEQSVDLVMLIDRVLCGLPFKSTGLTALRNGFIIPLKQKTITLADGKQVAPALFHTKVKLGAAPDGNKWGSWLKVSFEEFYLYRQPNGPTGQEIAAAFPHAKNYLQLSSEKLAALPNFADIDGPPAPPPETPRATEPPSRPKIIISSGKTKSETRPPTGENDYGARRNPPIDLSDDIPF